MQPVEELFFHYHNNMPLIRNNYDAISIYGGRNIKFSEKNSKQHGRNFWRAKDIKKQWQANILQNWKES